MIPALRRSAATLLLLTAGCGGRGGDDSPLPVDGAISADTPEATLAGLEILAEGGNAVDAAVAVSLALGVTQPSESGLGGTAVILVRPAGGDPVVIHAERPGAAGARVPTALHVLHHAWTRYGSGNVPWEALVQPAIRFASEGHALGRFTHRSIVREYDRIVSDPAAARLLLAGDRSIPPEASFRTNRELARVLERIAAEGPEALYAGPLGRDLAAAAEARGVAGGAQALAALPTPLEVPAVRGSYRGRTVWSAPEPFAGPRVLAALGLVDLAPVEWIGAAGWVRTGWLAEALVYASLGGGQHPVEYLSKLPPMPLPGGASPVVGNAASGVRGGGEGSALPSVRSSGREGATTHFSVVDGSGTAVSVTQTLGAPFGSGMAAGLGFFYGATDERGEPETLAPTIVTKDGEVELVLGSPGAERGLAAVVEVLVRALAIGEPLEDAVRAPRLYVAPAALEGRGRIFLEGVDWNDTLSVRFAARAAWGDSLEAHAAARGFRLGERDLGPTVEGLDAWFGSVNAVTRMNERWVAVADPRRGASAGTLVAGAPSLQRAPAASAAPPPPADTAPPDSTRAGPDRDTIPPGISPDSVSGPRGAPGARPPQ